MNPPNDKPLDPPASLPALLGQLLDDHGGRLAMYAAQWTDAPDDCVQEALIELARQSPLPERPVAWLYRVVKHRALNAARSHRRRKQREQLAWQRRLASQSHDTPASVAELLDALKQLPDEQREAVILKTWGGLTFAEIAEVMDLSTSQAHRHYQQGLEQLRKWWDSSCPKTKSNG